MLEVPRSRVENGAAQYSGFNSLELQEIYQVEKQPAVRSQITRGWGKPIIVRLPAGALLASQYRALAASRASSVSSAAEEAALCTSDDEGLSWSGPRLLGIRGRVSQLSALKNGSLIMATEGPAGLHRSLDGGQSWLRCQIDCHAPVMQGAQGSLVFGETGGIVETPDGELLCGCYGSSAPGHAMCFVLRSQDGGATWGDASFVAEGSEASFLLLLNGDLLGIVRTAREGAGEGAATLAIVRSSDGGRQWTAPRRFGLGAAQIPGFPLLLADGRLILLYGNRQFPFGVQAIASRDLGETWDLRRPIILAWFSWDNYCGHPRSIVMPDGSIMTGYYARLFKEGSPSQDIVSHALRWRAPDGWPRS